MLIEGPQPAAPFLRDRKDPPVAVMWWPARTVTSCDGTLAFSTGPWRRKGGQAMGRYFTIWQHDESGWHWLFDGGAEDHSPTPAGDAISAVRASCRGPAAPDVAQPQPLGGALPDGSFRWSLKPLDAEHYTLIIRYRAGKAWIHESAVVG